MQKGKPTVRQISEFVEKARSLKMMREVARRSRDGGREKYFPVLSPSFAIAQQPPRQRGPWVGIIHTPMSLRMTRQRAMASSSKTC